MLYIWTDHTGSRATFKLTTCVIKLHTLIRRLFVPSVFIAVAIILSFLKASYRTVSIMSKPKTLQLLDGTTTPWIAFGTGTALFGRHATEATLRALNAGFTHIDTAQAYANEDSTGDAIQQYLKSNTSKSRADIYVTTKLAQIPAGETVETTLRRSLALLKLDYVDLFLVHNPAHHVKREGGLKQVWKEVVEVKKKGLTKSIGVSNANVKFLEEIISVGEDIPTVNQVSY